MADRGKAEQEEDHAVVGPEWVQFQEQVNGNKTAQVIVTSNQEMAPGLYAGPSVSTPPADPSISVSMEASFFNGKVLANVYPENISCAWMIPARFNPYHIPKALTAEQLALPVEDYVTAMELITNDYRFRSYAVCYGRLIATWMFLSVIVLLVVLYSSPQGGLPVMIFALCWMLTVVIGNVLCCIIRKQMLIGLRHCVRSANKILLRHHLLAGVEDRGQLSCHKIVVIFVYFRCDDCIPEIIRLINTRNSTVQSANAATIEDAVNLILKYSQNYIKDFSKKKIRFPTRPIEGVSEFCPRHCAKSYCLCQYIQKRHFERGPRKWYERLFT